ncbi:GYF domain-containing protein [Rhodopirellula bahusiensis]|uniref:GYF domain-containing protein n=1 Tax=Rhodopirellula bahusiensis TaxID=2014065 RepID=UPI0032671B90
MSSTAEADEKFHIRRQGRRLGPFDRSQIDRMIARQKLGPKDEISLAGHNQWQRVDQWQLDQQATVDPGSKIDDAIGEEVSGIPNSGSNTAGANNAAVGDWYISNNGDRQGPIDEHTLGSWISEQLINAETLVWRSGMQSWKPAREVLPAALVSSLAAATHDSMSNSVSSSLPNDPGDGGYSLRDLRSRRAFWVLTVCIITYIFAVESFAAGLLQIYAAVATRRFENGGLVALWAVSSLIFAGLLLMTAVEITKLLSKMSRRGESENSVAVARHEHRVWLFAGLSAAFIIANQIVLAIFFLITIAQAT